MRNRPLTSLNTILSALLNTPFRPEILEIDGQELSYMRLEMPVAIDDIFAFLESQTLYPKVYFETPQEGAVAGIGKALEFNHLPKFQSIEGPRFFGGSNFMKRKKQTWGDFPNATYFLPLLEIEKKKEGTFLCVNRMKKDLEIHLEEESTLSPTSQRLSRLDLPSYPVWKQNVEELLQNIEDKRYLKVVLARCSRFECSSPLSPYAVLKNLKEKNRFAFQFSPKMTFIGTSPETLYRRQGALVETAAIAGTRPRGKTVEEDEMLMESLLSSPKEQHEVQLVSNMLKTTLSSICKEVNMEAQKVLKTSTVQHLYQSFHGTIKEGVDDLDLVKALHPTPAIGGYPKKEALLEIEKKEPFDRGWYSSPIGWVSPSKAHHLVAIRSALIEKKTLSLFAGAGIVTGSIPIKEWNELEHKIQQYKVFL